MSIIFGVRQPEGDIVAERQLLELAHATDRWAPDGTFVQAKDQIGMGFQPYHTHARSRLESQPVVDELGNMVTLDGRFDNHTELRERLEIADPDTSDSAIALAAFIHWGEKCFSEFIGDWALAIWSQTDRSLYLARDHAGTRTLYFEARKGTVLWATYLETFFVYETGRSLDEVYAACYLACEPIRDLTPFKDVRAVTPAYYVRIRENTAERHAHWEWMPKSHIHYGDAREYDVHFFSLFEQSVTRRTGPGTPILAQLSGGVDSTSVVCMSDYLRTCAGTNELLDTVSCYNDSEPGWNERPYFTAVEAQRGKEGFHIDVCFTRSPFGPSCEAFEFSALPGKDEFTMIQETRLLRATSNRSFRSILSGIGGDELLGGVPTSLPELADHIVCGEVRPLLRSLVAWSLANRQTVFSLIAEVIAFTYAMRRDPQTNSAVLPSWVTSGFRTAYLRSRSTDNVFANSHALLPSCTNAGRIWWALLGSMPHLQPEIVKRYEYRYPYLDRDLVEFLMRVPRHQLVRPGRRRFMMRRALANIVPAEVLERRRKGYLIRGPLLLLQSGAADLVSLLRTSIAAELGWIDSNPAITAVETLARGAVLKDWVSLLRLARLELWLRNLYRYRRSSAADDLSDLTARECRAAKLYATTARQM